MRILSTVIDTLIFDRTNLNLVAGDPKGKYDYVDYNRVGQATNYVANEIGGLSITAKTDWTNEDIPRASQMTKYRQDVKTIVDHLELSHQLPTNNKNILTLLGANQLEQALYDAHTIVQRIMRWDDVDDLYETWDELDAKELVWGPYFLKPRI